MPITIAFTLTAGCAMFVNLWFLRRALNRRDFLFASGQNGSLALIANSLVDIWLIILLSDILVFIAGVSLLIGFRPFGFLLAIVPVASTLVGFFALRGLLTGK